LDCSNNQLKGLDLKNVPSLKRLNCSSNAITKLDIEQDSLLEEIVIDNELLEDNKLLKNSFVFLNNKYIKKHDAQK
jgi:Leucine-rich repeat (LRR) protein